MVTTRVPPNECRSGVRSTNTESGGPYAESTGSGSVRIFGNAAESAAYFVATVNEQSASNNSPGIGFSIEALVVSAD